MRGLLACIIVTMSSLAAAPLSGCALDELPAQGVDPDEPLGSVSQSMSETYFMTYRTGGVRGGQVQMATAVITQVIPRYVNLAVTAEDGYKIMTVEARAAQDISEIPRTPGNDCPKPGQFDAFASCPDGCQRADLMVEIPQDYPQSGDIGVIHVAGIKEFGPETDRHPSAWAGEERFEDCPHDARYFIYSFAP